MLPSIFGVVIIHHNPVHYCNWVNLSNVATCFKMNSPMTGFPPWHCAELFAWPGLFTTHAALARSSVILRTPILFVLSLHKAKPDQAAGNVVCPRATRISLHDCATCLHLLDSLDICLELCYQCVFERLDQCKTNCSWTCEAIEQRLCHEDACGSGPGSGCRNQQALAGLVAGLDM